METIEKKLQTKTMQNFLQAILALKNEKEALAFLRDVLTVEELMDASRRWQVAQMLSQDKTFREIEEKTNMSSATISRINYWLHHGMGGYQLMLKRFS
ncbi:MAG: hypothetical protein A3H59_01330 [Candidatus Jacksonbacteria bacterium RIFCSPLOWO2_02_FULL_43_9]|nr:MAG: hypothetical protein A3B94_00870 [Candidatus Jacksonbacteria bacterium RIFCSPHIGHO2_02_FULL_43_10]OGY70808.1 MAG: hypothetical protein A2986_00465 [Candidatus Jacksonbacteria bacterium RIFCSPLOWO2_01_FULL_44_13]OGY73551.1 MAG: hypothetical protein A3H59_01330 [Candidatus Jacksonbacteria bacterium RIFCSPLOWO2_02_FULL_43_9]HAZ17112.1 TrpR YerC/YecD [Candidatus Jacksonbacteria bacterium]